MTIEMEPIGFVRTDTEKVPRNFRVSEVEGTLEIGESYAEGLADIEPGQRIVVIFHFHESPAFSPDLLRQTPKGPRRQGEDGDLQHLLAREAQPGGHVDSGRARGGRHDPAREGPGHEGRDPDPAGIDHAAPTCQSNGMVMLGRGCYRGSLRVDGERRVSTVISGGQFARSRESVTPTPRLVYRRIPPTS